MVSFGLAPGLPKRGASASGRSKPPRGRGVASCAQRTAQKSKDEERSAASAGERGVPFMGSSIGGVDCRVSTQKQASASNFSKPSSHRKRCEPPFPHFRRGRDGEIKDAQERIPPP